MKNISPNNVLEVVKKFYEDGKPLGKYNLVTGGY